MLISLLEPQFHSYVSQALIGRFHADLAHVTRDEINAHAQPIVERWQNDRRRDLVTQALSLARSNGRGVCGLRRVLRSLELGEVQALLLGENLQSHAVECSGCGHIDAHLVSFCPVCGRVTQEIVDVGEAILPWVIRRDIETFYVKDDPEFDKVGNIAALLHYRSGKCAAHLDDHADQLGKKLAPPIRVGCEDSPAVECGGRPNPLSVEGVSDHALSIPVRNL